jgi:hypothetical protein
MICSVCLDWYVLSVWIDMFCLSGMMCFVYLDWYVLSIWNDMFCLSIPDRQNISFQTDKTYHSRQTEHIIPDRQNISFQTFCLSGMICFVYLEWYVLSVWNDMFCLSGLICFVYLEWYVLSIWNDMFCPIQIDKTYHSRQTEHIIPDRQNISIQTDRTYHSR